MNAMTLFALLLLAFNANLTSEESHDGRINLYTITRKYVDFIVTQQVRAISEPQDGTPLWNRERKPGDRTLWAQRLFNTALARANASRSDQIHQQTSTLVLPAIKIFQDISLDGDRPEQLVLHASLLSTSLQTLHLILVNNNPNVARPAELGSIERKLLQMARVTLRESGAELFDKCHQYISTNNDIMSPECMVLMNACISIRFYCQMTQKWLGDDAQTIIDHPAILNTINAFYSQNVFDGDDVRLPFQGHAFLPLLLNTTALCIDVDPIRQAIWTKRFHSIVRHLDHWNPTIREGFPSEVALCAPDMRGLLKKTSVAAYFSEGSDEEGKREFHRSLAKGIDKMNTIIRVATKEYDPRWITDNIENFLQNETSAGNTLLPLICLMNVDWASIPPTMELK